MPRGTSYNWELQIYGQTIHLLTLGEFGEGEEGRIKTADGRRKYSIRDQIFDLGEIECTILIQRSRFYYNLMQRWCLSGDILDAFLIGRDAAGNAMMTYLLSECECAMGKKNEFDRKSKKEDTKKYFLLPYLTEEIV